MKCISVWHGVLRKLTRSLAPFFSFRTVLTPCISHLGRSGLIWISNESRLRLLCWSVDTDCKAKQPTLSRWLHTSNSFVDATYEYLNVTVTLLRDYSN